MKVQRVRWCSQCESLLPLKCTKCLSHPERTPKQVELFDLPEILETGPCGCVRFACQIITYLARSKDRSTMVKCAHCQKLIKKNFSDLAGKQNSFCSPLHYKLWRISEAEKAKELLKETNQDGYLQMFTCNSKKCCGDIQEHKRHEDKKSSRMYQCLSCLTVKQSPGYALGAV